MLKFNFGFKKILFVFSGRRGMHIWVFDDKCMHFSELTRKTIIASIKNLKFDLMDRTLKSILNLMLETFLTNNPSVLFEKDFTEQIFAKITQIDEKIETNLRNLFEKLQKQNENKNEYTSTNFIFDIKRESQEKEYICLRNSLYSLVCVPRIDESVTERSYHPIKMPYCVHASTTNICFTIKDEELINFYPDDNTVVKLVKLLQNDKDTLERFKKSIENISNIL